MFSVAAEAYDRYMGKFSSLLAPLFAEYAGVAPGSRALDVGCGPGALTGELARVLGPESVAAVDPSPLFAEAARERNPGVDVRLATAEALPFADGEFDLALAQLVVHFMADPVAGLRELRRVTRAGGVVAACVWDFGTGRGPLGPFWDVARQVDPDVHDESGRPGTRPGELARLLGEAGLRDVAETELSVSVAHATFEEWWEPFTFGVGPGGVYLASLPHSRQVELSDALRATFGGSGPTVAATAWAARGVV